MLHQSFTQSLQVQVYTQCQVLPRFWLLVERPVLILTLNTAMGIAKEYLNTFLASQLFLIRPFHT